MLRIKFVDVSLKMKLEQNIVKGRGFILLDEDKEDSLDNIC
jgi:hypothetical protein